MRVPICIVLRHNYYNIIYIVVLSCPLIIIRNIMKVNTLLCRFVIYIEFFVSFQVRHGPKWSQAKKRYARDNQHAEGLA
jgi:hypothetical protein